MTMSLISKIRFAVFSYNRGQFLENCILSILINAPDAKVDIFDDGSSDPVVHRVLRQYEKLVRVIPRQSEELGYHGGLYSNMQRALNASEEDEYLVFIQDDQQVIRPLLDDDVAHWGQFFSRNDSAFQLSAAFLKRGSKLDVSTVTYDTDTNSHYMESTASRRSFYSDVGVFNASRMKEYGWVFGKTEGDNEAKARSLNAKAGISPYPFMMYLPYANSTKFKKRGLLLRFAEWYHAYGYYPFQVWDREEANAFFKRDPEVLPYAEDLLTLAKRVDDTVWMYEDATKSIKWIHKYYKRKKKALAALSNH